MPVVKVDKETWKKIVRLQKLWESRTGISIPKSKIVKLGLNMADFGRIFTLEDLIEIQKKIEKRVKGGKL